MAAIASSGRSPMSGGRRSMRVRNSYSRNSRTTVSRSYSPTRPRLRSSSTSTSRTSRISSRLSSTMSRYSSSSGRSFSGVTSSMCWYRTSRVFHVAISFEAVFSPTPGIPGMLSVGSPLSAL